jgi:predicted ATPase
VANRPSPGHLSHLHPTPAQILTIARGQQAKSRELLAALRLSRWWQHQGNLDEAYQVLAEVYHWFREGFDTLDLQEAKVLLEQLS